MLSTAIKLRKVTPVRPVWTRYNRRWRSTSHNPYSNYYWRNLLDTTKYRPSFWASDVRHKYLIKTGTDYQGQTPVAPPSGMYQNLHINVFGGHFRHPRETRALPIEPLSPRTIYEHRLEAQIDYSRKRKEDRRRILSLRDQEFHAWYMKLQRVRGRWCKENGVSSRGIYGPAVDAAEIWG